MEIYIFITRSRSNRKMKEGRKQITDRRDREERRRKGKERKLCFIRDYLASHGLWSLNDKWASRSVNDKTWRGYNRTLGKTNALTIKFHLTFRVRANTLVIVSNYSRCKCIVQRSTFRQRDKGTDPLILNQISSLQTRDPTDNIYT